MHDLPWIVVLALPIAFLLAHARRVVAAAGAAGLGALLQPWLSSSVMVTLVLYVLYLTWH
jgi:hypothetical protein